MVGSLLGDATLLKTTSGYCFRVHHGTRQQDLVAWKHGKLARLVRTPPRVSGSGCYFRTVSHPEITALRTAFYVGQRKIVPIDLLRADLSALGLAVWIMDDGAADGKQLRINTQGFTRDDAEILAGLLRAKFGINMTINEDKGRPRLRCGAGSMPRLIELVGPHMLPSMLYKLSL